MDMSHIRKALNGFTREHLGEQGRWFDVDLLHRGCPQWWRVPARGLEVADGRHFSCAPAGTPVDCARERQRHQAPSPRDVRLPEPDDRLHHVSDDGEVGQPGFGGHGGLQGHSSGRHRRTGSPVLGSDRKRHVQDLPEVSVQRDLTLTRKGRRRYLALLTRIARGLVPTPSQVLELQAVDAAGLLTELVDIVESRE